ncbi:hypothetical protein BXZ70DRAFT_665670 [Cristinia sonorae]|uniref:Uncharacterized protein n=1 Tax=Cristinia sonorae TaxID=1940300 RepID=A0A8K0UVN2_9AGAR|nr:hypothetical protein BXZ70DRAFT_665670 [Cristinia sonorae]
MTSEQSTAAPSTSRSSLPPLWTQLLHRNPPAFNLAAGSAPMPPIAPVDKAGTSVRILLHDTQVQFEKFSERVVKLTDGVEVAKREVVTMQKLFEREHERILDEMVELANRCQTQIQKSIGTPAQVSRVDELHTKLSSIDGRVAALDHKIDMLQMLNQTQTQALQTLQDQQGQLLAALTPLLPLLQAIPLHIENSKHDVKDAISRSQQNCSADMQSMLAATTFSLRRSSSDNSSTAVSDLPSSSLPAYPVPSSPSDRASRKRRRVESSEQRAGSARRELYPSPRASGSDSQLRTHTTTPKSRAPSRLFTSPAKASSSNPTSTSATTGGDPTVAMQKSPSVTPLSEVQNRNRWSLSPEVRSADALRCPSLAKAAAVDAGVPITTPSSIDSNAAVKIPPKPFSLKDMKTPLIGTKRFIPIDDDEDDEDTGMVQPVS